MLRNTAALRVHPRVLAAYNCVSAGEKRTADRELLLEEGGAGAGARRDRAQVPKSIEIGAGKKGAAAKGFLARAG